MMTNDHERQVRCLVIEGDEMFTETVSMLLESMGHAVERVGSGHEAISRFSVDPFDVVLIASQDRWETARSIKNAAPSAWIVLMTANRGLLQSDGVDVILHKPFSEDDLMRALPTRVRRRMPKTVVYVRGLDDQGQVIEHGHLIFQAGTIRPEGSDVVHRLLAESFPAWLKRDDPESWPLAYHGSRLWCSVAKPHE